MRGNYSPRPDVIPVAYPDGIDISAWQGNEFNPNLYKPDFFIARAGYGLAPDSTFGINVNKAIGLNVPILAYWYMLPNQRVSDQIAMFLKITQGQPINAYCLDYEEWKNPDTKKIYTCAEISTHMVLAFSQLAASVDKLILYTGRSYLKSYLQPAKQGFKDFIVNNVSLWIAIPQNEPFEITAPFQSVLFRQYGTVTTPGFSSPVDHDSFIGTLDQLRTWAGLPPFVSLESRVAALENQVKQIVTKIGGL